MNFKKNIIKIFSLITMFILFVKYFSIKFYLANITKDFRYLDNNLLFLEAEILIRFWCFFNIFYFIDCTTINNKFH